MCNPPVPLGGVTSIFWTEPNSRRDSPQRQPHSQGASCSRFQGEPGNLYIIHHLEPSILLPWEISTLPKNISQLLIPLFKEMAKLFSSIELFLLTINPCWKVKTKILIFDVRLNISSTKVLEPLFIFKNKYLYFAGLSPSKVYVAPHSYFESYENLTPNIIITITNIILIIIIPGKLMIIVFTMAARPAATELAPKIIAGIPALTLPGQRMIIIIFMIIRSLGSWWQDDGNT